MNGSAPASNQRLSGILYMTAASAAFALMVVCVKWTARTLPIFEVVFFRSLSGTLMIAWMMRREGASFLGKETGKLIMRGVSGFIALSLHFLTISKLPLGTAVMLNYTAPVFAAVLAAVFLGEKPGWFLWTMIAVSFGGIYLLTLPPGHQNVSYDSIYIFLGLLSGFAAAVAYTAIRSIRDQESPLTIIFYFTAIATAGSSFFLVQGFEWPDLAEWVGLSGVAVGSYFGQLWMTMAFRKAPASLVSPFSYLTPVLAFFLGFLFWKDPITRETLIGAGLIFLTGSLISVREAARGRVISS